MTESWDAMHGFCLGIRACANAMHSIVEGESEMHCACLCVRWTCRRGSWIVDGNVMPIKMELIVVFSKFCSWPGTAREVCTWPELTSPWYKKLHSSFCTCPVLLCQLCLLGLYYISSYALCLSTSHCSVRCACLLQSGLLYWYCVVGESATGSMMGWSRSCGMHRSENPTG
jgi:hypothetical protein